MAFLAGEVPGTLRFFAEALVAAGEDLLVAGGDLDRDFEGRGDWLDERASRRAGGARGEDFAAATEEDFGMGQCCSWRCAAVKGEEEAAVARCAADEALAAATTRSSFYRTATPWFPSTRVKCYPSPSNLHSRSSLIRLHTS
jgi:hypothetical protein